MRKDLEQASKVFLSSPDKKVSRWVFKSYRKNSEFAWFLPSVGVVSISDRFLTWCWCGRYE